MSFSLVCLPFAGGGASFYRTWNRLGVEGVRVLAPQLPGREERFADEPFTEVGKAAAHLADETQRLATGDDPVALFGHSFGAMLAHETARELQARGFSRLRHLFVSGAPLVPEQRGQWVPDLDDDTFAAGIEEIAGYRHPAFDNPELRAMLLPALRADVAMHQTYRPDPAGRPLALPVTALRGADDHLVGRAQLEQWSAVTTGTFRTAELPGGHMYLVDSARDLLQWTADHLE
ncbi:surfactin synthase thioesterase subunit [Kitasatospora sp. MAA4]|uniref:thioesterase II family protein n=1 Tax=Kitasatospora sp. MAA4 TaxID=3035093 RepID=UPI002474F46C|nr:alpha/beta fold hydrolase [Kitasatospora sp. MAA4]MDH6136207.1 surfactin synthase thioesterase subunit [Kitasatospora sp. MAA4]